MAKNIVVVTMVLQGYQSQTDRFLDELRESVDCFNERLDQDIEVITHISSSVTISQPVEIVTK